MKRTNDREGAGERENRNKIQLLKIRMYHCFIIIIGVLFISSIIPYAMHAVAQSNNILFLLILPRLSDLYWMSDWALYILTKYTGKQTTKSNETSMIFDGYSQLLDKRGLFMTEKLRLLKIDSAWNEGSKMKLS